MCDIVSFTSLVVLLLGGPILFTDFEMFALFERFLVKTSPT